MALVLVTGATGRIGSALLPALLARGDTVRAIVRPKSAAQGSSGPVDAPASGQSGAQAAASARAFGSAASLPAGVQRFEWDLASGPLPKQAYEGVLEIVHLAGLVGSHPYGELVLQNAFATKNLLSACPTSVRKIVIASSISVYGEYRGQLVDESFPPKAKGGYGKSKLASETFARNYSDSLSVVFLRFGMIYGPGFEEGYFAVFDHLARGKMRILGSGKNRVPLLHINDAVRAMLLCLNSRVESGREYNIVGEEKMTQGELLSIAAEEMAVAAPKARIPAALAFALASARQFLSSLRIMRPPPFTSENVRQLSLDRAYSCERAKGELGFEARVKIRDGIKEMVQLYREKTGKKE